MKKEIIILGAGESGIGAAILALKKGFNVFVSDSGPIKEKYKSVLLHHKISFEEGKHTEKKILRAEEVIKSPGIPEKAEIVIRLKNQNIPVISEIEFAGRYTDAKKICITGSNGKTTTTLLTYHILKNAGLNAGLAGNVGQSFALQVAEKNFDTYVLEISSFQLDGMFDFKADIAVITNITPDHLDRYDYNFQYYIDSKFRIIRNQHSADAFIYCADDPVVLNELSRKEIKAGQFPFSIKKMISGQGAFCDEKSMYINIKLKTLKMTLENLALQGKHNIYNSMAAGIISRIVDIRSDKVKASLADFKNVEHRLEFIARIHGVDYINDSKATNVNSAWYALESMNNPVIWIAGGIDKGNDYNLLKDLVSQKVKAIICLGKDNSKLKKAFEGTVNTIFETTSMIDAVRWASSIGKKDDVVLLSPACASFDLFENYEERGNLFKAAVNKL